MLLIVNEQEVLRKIGSLSEYEKQQMLNYFAFDTKTLVYAFNGVKPTIELYQDNEIETLERICKSVNSTIDDTIKQIIDINGSAIREFAIKQPNLAYIQDLTNFCLTVVKDLENSLKAEMNLQTISYTDLTVSRQSVLYKINNLIDNIRQYGL